MCKVKIAGLPTFVGLMKHPDYKRYRLHDRIEIKRELRIIDEAYAYEVLNYLSTRPELVQELIQKSKWLDSEDRRGVQMAVVGEA